MLFSGLACFSPTVVPAIRKLWVKNGGTLTHTDADFRKANYFFCDGMEDPWLNELLSRCLIVRHASWVTLCVAEDFCMPIAAYTLDDHFDLSKIQVIDPPPLKQTLSRAPVTDDSVHVIPLGLASAAPEPPRPSRKRPFDHGYDLAENQRPRKKLRIDAHDWFKPELSATNCLQKATCTGIDGHGKTAPAGRLTSNWNSKKASRAVKLFKSQIRPKANLRPTAPKVVTSVLNSTTLFWNDLLAKRQPDSNSNTPLILSVNDLLRAPPTRAALFTVDEEFLGRTFIDSRRAN